MSNRTPDLTVIYNDTCPICSREVDAYRRASERHGLSVAYAGLSDTDLAAFGLTRDQAARRFHVMKDGNLHDGLGAFALVWERIPHLAWLARLVRLPVIGPLSDVVYDHLAAPALYALHRRRERKRHGKQ